MKFFYSLALLFIFAKITAQAPLVQMPDSLKKHHRRDTSWKTPGLFSISASQTSLSNWQGGGTDNLSVISIFKFDPVYKKGNHEWINKIDLKYGVIKPGDFRLYRKNVDQIFLLTKYNRNAFSKYWFYTTQADFRSQFAPGYNYSGDSIVGRATSDFMSPGYIQLLVGLDFRPKDYFSVTFAPLAGKITVVNRQHLADEGAYGVDKAVVDDKGQIITHGKKIRYEFGGRVIVKFKKEISKNVNLDSYLDLFSNYMHNPGNIDVVFNNMLTFKINKYFNASIISQILYDDDIITKRDWNHDGLYDNPSDINGPRLQALTTISFGFGFTF
ncbi:MAG: DUF3078 domain-containing protein [Bacteroidetes bacterium]|nr:DUF3078 domain-containing protein [Bacteroidota bacterium]